MFSLRPLSRVRPFRRWIHATAARQAVTTLQMPAMSPTMTEGGIAAWKKAEGETFIAGDVLLEIETDKATIDVEAPEDGIMGKILLPDGTKNIPIGKAIALLAEEGDDISNLQPPPETAAEPAPKQESASASAPAPTPAATAAASAKPTAHPSHSRPLFPSVLRLLAENSIQNADAITGTGVRGMLTKGDVLTYLGKASGPLGSYKEGPTPIQIEALKTAPSEKKAEPVALDGAALRRLIVSNMLAASVKARTPSPSPDVTFNSIIADYLPEAAVVVSSVPPAPTKASKTNVDYLDGLI